MVEGVSDVHAALAIIGQQVQKQTDQAVLQVASQALETSREIAADGAAASAPAPADGRGAAVDTVA